VTSLRVGDPGGNHGSNHVGEHVGELRLRRFRLGELAGEEQRQVADHTADCAGCRTRLEALADEQRAFEHAIPFARFAGGVERAARVPRASEGSRRLWLAGALAAAAAAGLLLLVRPAGSGDGDGPGANRLKGGDAPLASVRLAAPDGAQRSAASGADVRLQPGERLRLGYRVPGPAQLVALSVDDAGQITPLYPERGSSLPVDAGSDPAAGLHYLPDSVELTGSGRERVYLFLASRPFTVDDAAAATRAAFDRTGRGDLGKMEEPGLAAGPAEVFSWLFHKP
jgi:hypothetical protein